METTREGGGALIMLSLNEATDSSGKKVPSITPVDSSSKIRRRLERGVPAHGFGQLVDVAAADAELQAGRVCRRFHRHFAVENDARAMREHRQHFHATVLTQGR